MDIERSEAPPEASLEHGRDFWVNPWHLFGVSEAVDAGMAQKIGHREYRRLVKLYYPDAVVGRAYNGELTDEQQAECLRRYDLLDRAWSVFKDRKAFAVHLDRVGQADVAICSDLRTVVYPDGRVVSLGIELPFENEVKSNAISELSLGSTALSSVIVRQRVPGYVKQRYEYTYPHGKSFDLSL